MILSEPTVTITVDNVNQVVSLMLPPIYLDNGVLPDGTLRVDIYTTVGMVNMDLSGYEYYCFYN